MLYKYSSGMRTVIDFYSILFNHLHLRIRIIRGIRVIGIRDQFTQQVSSSSSEEIVQIVKSAEMYRKEAIIIHYT